MHRFGQVVVVGRPNVGKSTLVNALVGAKVSIVTPKPQTTRNRIAGIRTLPDAQIVFLDTPGMHAARSPLNRRLVQRARETLEEADVTLLVLDARAGLAADDERLLRDLRAAPTVVALNKIDRVAKPALLPILAAIAERTPDVPVVPVSALRREHLDPLLRELVARLPEGPAAYDTDDFTTASSRFLCQELIREQVFLATEQEIPYGSAVVVDRFEEDAGQGLLRIHATILVEREGHKPIVIGRGGQRLRTIGQAARLGIEALLSTRVHLELFVRVEPAWFRRRDRLAELDL